MSTILNLLSIKSRLILMLLMVTLLSSLVIGYLGWRNGRVALSQTSLNQLTSIRSAQTYEIESYFDFVTSHTRTLAEDRMIVNAMKQFREGYEVGIHRTLTPEENDQVTAYYDDIFTPRLAKSFDNMPLSILYRPRRTVASYFQYHYLVNNPFPVGQKDELAISDGDTTIYNRFHQFYHPILRNLLLEFDYYDIFLIDIETGNIVYSVFKETDFATSLREGPYRESGLGVLADRIHHEPERGAVAAIDFRTYAPSYGSPAAFVGSPIFDGSEAVGILAVQISVDEINKVMTGDDSWVENGLGSTGESYLVGPDRLMRSSSRSYIEDPDNYTSTLRDFGVSEKTIENINHFGTTILMQPVATDSVTFAFDGQEGTHVTTNYLGQPVLSSYAPLDILGLEWVIISEMTEAEAFEPIFELQRNIVIWGVVLVLSVAFLAVILSRYFVRPIEKLTQGAQALGEGADEVHIDIESNDEFGDLARSFNSMVDNMRTQSDTIVQKTMENEHLLLNILPASITERIKTGERIADQQKQVSVVYLHVLGFTKLSEQIGAAAAANCLETLIDQFGNAAERFEVEMIRTFGDTYVAACGLTSARLDHARRAVDFAVAALQIIERFNADYHYDLKMQIGIDSGPVISGVVGTKRFNFEMWGETVDVASRIYIEGAPNTILITEHVYERLGTHKNFTPTDVYNYHNETIAMYEYRLTSTERLSIRNNPSDADGPNDAGTEQSEADGIIFGIGDDKAGTATAADSRVATESTQSKPADESELADEVVVGESPTEAAT